MNHFNTFKIIPFISLSALLSACGVSGAPDCNDDSVTSLVKEITLNLIKDDYAKYYSPYAGGMKYSALKEAVANGSKSLNHYLIDVERDSSEAKISLSNFRTQLKDQEIQKSECACQITMDRKSPLTKEILNQSIPITYTAQNLDEGKNIYVEVFGL